MNARLIRRALVIGALGAIPLTHAGEIATPSMLANTCAGCHGTGGNSPGRIPSIQGMSAEAVGSAMRRYKAGTRPSTIMGRIARGYTGEEIDAIASFYAGTK